MNKNDFASTPPMGWICLTDYDTKTLKQYVKANAEYIAQHLKKYGWEYIVVDTQWSAFTEAADMDFRWLSDYIHRLGLKFGIHIKWDPPDDNTGQVCCDTFIERCCLRGIDYIYCDNISYHDRASFRNKIKLLSDTIKKYKRPIVLAVSPSPAVLEEGWHYASCTNQWRISDGLLTDFDAFKRNLFLCQLWQTHVRRGCYPDCGTLPLFTLHSSPVHEDTSFTVDEARSILSLWCLYGSPLMLSGDLTIMNPDTLSLLKNHQLLALLTPDCVPHQICLDDKKAIWQADNPLQKEHYAAFFNLSEEIQTLSIPLHDLGYYSSSARLTDLWKGNLASTIRGRINARLNPHACIVYRVEF